jgi:hypothetical protein
MEAITVCYIAVAPSSYRANIEHAMFSSTYDAPEICL